MNFPQAVFLQLLILSITAADDDLTLDGSQYISYSMMIRPEHKSDIKLSVVFKTSLPSCMLFFASGISGDFILLELYRGKIRFASSSTGSNEHGGSPSVEIIYGENFADDEYHQINVEMGESTRLYAYTFPYGNMPAKSVKSTTSDLRFDLDEAAYFAGMPESHKYRTAGIALSQRNFEGCLNVISWSDKVIAPASLSRLQSSPFKFHGSSRTGCAQAKPPFFLKTLLSQSDSIEITRGFEKESLNIDFFFRTYESQASLFSVIHSGLGSSSFLRIMADELHLVVDISSTFRVRLVHQLKSMDDGAWNRVAVNISAVGISFQLNDNRTRYEFNTTVQISFPDTIAIGAEHENAPSFIGCLKDIRLGTRLSPINQLLLIDPAKSYAGQICQLQDHCFPRRPCKNFGRCYQNATAWRCDCQGTGFFGPTCEDQEKDFHQTSCSSYYLAGYRSSGLYLIKPGDVEPFEVFCNMTSDDGPFTAISTNIANDSFVFTSKDFDDQFYFHYISYRASRSQIRALINRSFRCRQLVRYNCYQSTLLDSRDGIVVGDYGVRWYSQLGSYRQSWGGTSTNSSLCSCGAKGACVDKRLACNCDAMRPQMLTDEGYLTDMEDLPVSKLRISTQKTNHRSAFYLGSLECFDGSSPIPAGTQTPQATVAPSEPPEQESLTESPFQSQVSSDPFVSVSSTRTDQFTNSYRNSTSVIDADKGNTAGNIMNRLLHVVIISVCSLLVLAMVFIGVCWWRQCCCVARFKKRNVSGNIVVYGERALSGSNNFGKKIGGYFSDMDIHINAVKRALSPTLQESCSSDDSFASNDVNRYLDGDYDVESVGSGSKSRDYIAMPKRSILKITKDIQKRPEETDVLLQERRSPTEIVRNDISISSGELKDSTSSERRDYELRQATDVPYSSMPSTSLKDQCVDHRQVVVTPSPTAMIVDVSKAASEDACLCPRENSSCKIPLQQGAVDILHDFSMYDQLMRPPVPKRRNVRFSVRDSLEGSAPGVRGSVRIDAVPEQGLLDGLKEQCVFHHEDLNISLV